MPSLFPALASAALLGLATAASAADDASQLPMPAEAGIGENQSAVDTVPELETPFQVVAFAGALLIWRNRRRTSRG